MSRNHRVSSTLAGFLSIALFVTGLGSTANAHGFHFGRHHGHYGWNGGGWNGGWGGSWGAYGMGGGFRHSGFGYSGYGFGFPSYSYTSVNIGFPAYRSYYSNFNYGCNYPIVYRPVVYTPIYYRPIYYSPIQYSPIQCNPIQHWPVAAIPLCLTSTPINYYGSSSQINSAIANSLHATNNQLTSKIAKTDYTPSTAWTNDAIDLIDAMANQGGASEGYAACKQLMKTHPSLPGHFYTRAAVLAALTNQDSAIVLEHLATAKDRSANKDGADLPGGSIRSYVAKIPNASMDSLLNRVAAKALSKEDGRKSELSLLANFLAMDGQQERASRFESAIDAPTKNLAPELDTRALAMAK